MGASASVRTGSLPAAGSVDHAVPMPVDEEISSWERDLRRQSQIPLRAWPAHDAAVEDGIREWESSLKGEQQAELEQVTFSKASPTPTPPTPGAALLKVSLATRAPTPAAG